MWDFSGHGDFNDAPSAGAILHFDVSLLRDSAGRGRVGLVHRDADSTQYVSFTPAQARQLAAWLRLAATSGKTVADAKRNHRKGS